MLSARQGTSTQQAPVIAYVKGLSVDRVGQESDRSILSDYIKQRYIVITVDYGGDARAVSPAIDGDFHPKAIIAERVAVTA